MPANNKNTPSADLSALLEGLCKAEIQFILVGGLAAVVQGAPVTTLDVDIVYKRDAENIAKIFSFLKSIAAFHRRPDDKIIEPKEKDFQEMSRTLLTTRLGPLDILTFIEGGKIYEDLVENTIEIPFRGHMIRVLELKTLIDLKRTSKDAKDKQRLPILEETLRQLKKE